MKVPVFACQYDSTNALYTCCSYLKDKLAKPAGVSNSSAVSEIGARWLQK